MTPVDQLVPHDPANGVVGDCFRACLASLLDLPAAEVPHFGQVLYDRGGWDMFRCADPSYWDLEVNAFLRARGLALIALPSWDMAAWARAYGARDVYHLISGPSPRFPTEMHCVVGLNGEMVHDPYAGDRRGVARDDPSKVVFDLLIHTGSGA